MFTPFRSVNAFASRIRAWLSPRRVDQDFQHELQAHLDLLTDENISRGMSPEEARRAARIRLGGATQLAETNRELRGLPLLETLFQDLRHALRMLRKSPGFAAVVVLTLALGIGANTAIFTLVHAILLKALPVGDPKSLYRLGDKDDCCLNPGLDNENGEVDIFSYDLYRYLRETTPEFENLAAMQAGPNVIGVRRGSNTQAQQSEFVSGNYFATFGVGAFAGHLFTDVDDRPDAPPVAVMSYQAWQSVYDGDPSVIGATFYLQSQPVTLVGIAPPGFFGDRITSNPPAFWIPLSAEPLLTRANSVLRHPDEAWLYAIGRVKPATSVNALQQKISANLRLWLLTQDSYTRNGGAARIPKLHVVLSPGGAGIQSLQQQSAKKLYLLLAVSGLVLLIACANVANLLLARSTKRKAEIAVRIALGSARSRLIRQMLTESLLLGGLGGLAGLTVAYAGTRAILALAFPDSPHNAIHATPSLAVLGFAFLVSLSTGVLFGIVPAWIISRGDPAEALRGMNRSIGDRASLPQKSLIIFQVALSLVLLVGAGLLTRSLRKMEHQDFGLQTNNRYVLHLDPAAAGYPPEKLDTLYRALERDFAAIPGMQTSAVALFTPMDGNQWVFQANIPGRPLPEPDDHHKELLNRVTPNFFAAIGQPVIRGRGFTEADNAPNSRFVAVVNQAFADKFFPNQDPIGLHFGSYDQEDIGAYEIVGVVANAKYTDPRDAAKPMFFRPLSQWQHELKDPTAVSIETQSHYVGSIIMKFRDTPRNLGALVSAALERVDPNLTVIDLHSLDFQLEGTFNQERLIARLTTLFGLLTLVVASVGLYGITSYQVTQRTREIGLRMAFGANRQRVIGLMLRGTLIQLVLGLALGVPIALVAAHYIADQLFIVKSNDPVSLSLAILALCAAAVIAAIFPARRASKVDPMIALRQD